jgi:hypothetical protein
MRKTGGRRGSSPLADDAANRFVRARRAPPRDVDDDERPDVEKLSLLADSSTRHVGIVDQRGSP